MADSICPDVCYPLYIMLKLLKKPMKNPDHERGSTLIEFLIVFALWLAIFFTFISMFFLNNLQGSMVNAVNLGLERAAIVGGTTTEVRNLINNQLKHTGVDIGLFAVTGSGSDASRVAYGQYITISITGPRKFTDWSSGHPVTKSETVTVTKTIMSQYLP